MKIWRVISGYYVAPGSKMGACNSGLLPACCFGELPSGLGLYPRMRLNQVDPAEALCVSCM